MTLSRGGRAVPRWLTMSLGLLLTLGHACELPALVDPASHASEGSHHHADESLMSCEAVGVSSSAGHIPTGVSLDLAERLSAAPAHVHAARGRAEPSGGLPSRTPLFLLHASLLI